MKKLLPVLIAIIGLAAGTAAGMFLRPAPEADRQEPGAEQAEAGAEEGGSETGEDVAPEGGGSEADEEAARRPAAEAVEYVKLNNQFVVPVVASGRVAALVVLSLSVEVPQGAREKVYAVEPRLRDALLQVMFRHANSGGFDGTFTAGEKMRDLRASLRKAAREVLGKTAQDVLVVDIVRQDV